MTIFLQDIINIINILLRIEVCFCKETGRGTHDNVMYMFLTASVNLFDCIRRVSGFTVSRTLHIVQKVCYSLLIKDPRMNRVCPIAYWLLLLV